MKAWLCSLGQPGKSRARKSREKLFSPVTLDRASTRWRKLPLASNIERASSDVLSIWAASALDPMLFSWKAIPAATPLCRSWRRVIAAREIWPLSIDPPHLPAYPRWLGCHVGRPLVYMWPTRRAIPPTSHRQARCSFMIYSLTSLGLRPNTLGAVMPKLQDTVTQSIKAGSLVGCFSCEFGVLNRILVLAGYENENAAAEDRAAVIAKNNPFGLAEWLGSFEQGTFTPLPFTTPIQPGKYGPYYEIRTYQLAAGGLGRFTDAWAKVVERRNAMSKLLMVMASREYAPMRMVHIWPYATLEDRFKARTQASKEGIWPPPGGSDDLLSLQSELFVSTGFSPLG